MKAPYIFQRMHEKIKFSPIFFRIRTLVPPWAVDDLGKQSFHTIHLGDLCEYNDLLSSELGVYSWLRMTQMSHMCSLFDFEFCLDFGKDVLNSITGMKNRLARSHKCVVGQTWRRSGSLL